MDSTIGRYSTNLMKRERPKVGRPLEACVQCQRRKQKCNREWPCGNCQSRKVAHLCEFSRQTSQKHLGTASEVPVPKRTKRLSTAIEKDSSRYDNLSTEPAKSLRLLGYMEVEELNEFRVQHNGGEEDLLAGPERYPREIEEALNAIPSKTQTDVLVRHALEMVDYVRVTLYPSQVLGQYETWWPTRRSQKNLNFSSLILRLCSLALQCLPTQLRQHIEDELGDDVQFLTERYHNAAKQLSDFSDLGVGDLMHVQQLFLTAAWLKADGFFTRAWHYLGAAIREAQELGIHHVVTEESISEMDRELRRRIWCSLYTWDRFMSIILRRPYLIDESSCNVHLPSPNLEMDTEQPDVPSPIVEQLLKYRAAQITVQISALKDKTDTKAVSALLQKLCDLLDSVPAALKFNYSSPSLDKQHPRLKFARHKILLDVYVSTFMLLKQVLLVDGSASHRAENSQDISSYRIMACDYGIRLIELTAHMVELFNPEKAKDHQVVFTPFDTAMTLCVALKKDTKTVSLPRGRIVIAIGEALCTLSRMESFSKLAKQGAKVLRELVANLSLTTREKDIILVESLQRREPPTVFQPGVFGKIPSSDTPEASSNGFQALHAQPPTVNRDILVTAENATFENERLDLFAEPLDSEWRDGIDLGILDDVFHWDELLNYES